MELRKKVYSWSTQVMIIIIMCIFPLYTKNKFFSIEGSKMTFWIYSVLLCTIPIVICGLSRLKKIKKASELSLLSISSLKLSLPDKAILAFAAIATLSTVLSRFPEDSFSGAAGRHQGLAVILTYTLMYFVISRFLDIKPFLFQFFMIASCLVCILAIVNHLGYDPFGFYDQLTESSRFSFISTIGNVDFFSGFCCLIVPLCLCLYCKSISVSMTFFSGICLFIAASGLGSGNTDGGFLGIGAVVLILIVYTARHKRTFARFTEAMMIFLAGLILIHYLTPMFPRSIPLSGVMIMIFSSHTIYILFFACLAGRILTAALWKNHKKGQKNITLSRVFLVIICLSAVSVAILLIYINLIAPEKNPGPLDAYFRFDQSWGSSRGREYVTATHILSGYDVKASLIGCGPDVYGNLVLELQKTVPATVYTNNAHCEYLEYLLTTGILGLVSYLMFIFSVIRDGILLRKNPYIAGITLAVIAYAVQAAISINQMATTPIFFTMLAIIECKKRCK